MTTSAATPATRCAAVSVLESFMTTRLTIGAAQAAPTAARLPTTLGGRNLRGGRPAAAAGWACSRNTVGCIILARRVLFH